MLRDYQVNDLSQMCRIWNAVVAQGNAFPQLEQLDEQSGDVFFFLAEQNACLHR